MNKTAQYTLGVQRDGDNKIDTIVLDFGKSKFNRVFMNLNQARWLMENIQNILSSVESGGVSTTNYSEYKH